MSEKANEPTPAVGRVVHFHDPRLPVNANDGMGRGPYPAEIMQVSPATDQVPLRLHLKVSKWGNDAYYSFVLPKASASSDTPYWVWPPRV